ncbi:DUF2599 domain-containing protein [Agromyces sp. SYSU T00266]|uniref:DUF2599 domain-containing protein n=1 Tax=Agromyces zhanjiangensis TaxID=3158562 RepID=UPI003390B244
MRLATTTAGMVALLAVAGVAPANAASSDAGPLDAIERVAPQVLTKVAEATMKSRGTTAIASDEVNGVEVEVPIDPSDGIAVTNVETGLTIGVGLPSARSADDAVVEAEGVVSYDNGDGSVTVPVVKDDGSVQIMTVIEDSTAPTDYAYALDIPADATVGEDAETGLVKILDADGGFLAGVAPAWALDANGDPVATHYEISGDALVQVIDHGAGTAYPVVADPWLGIALIDKVTKTWYSGKGYRYHVYPTWWGRGGAGWGARWEAWSETKKKGVPQTSTLENQFYCHYDYRPVTTFKDSWNLESWAPDKGYWGFMASVCN